MRFDPDALVDGGDVERLAVALLGAPLRDRPGSSHVAAVWSPGDGRNRVLRVDPRSPQSETDHFVLRLARARADAIVSTAAILRAEPDLRFDLVGSGAGALMRWRVEAHGLGPPTALILSRSADVDPEHPALWGPAHVVLYVPEDRVDDLRERLGSSRWVTVQGDAEPGARRAIEWLRRERGCRGISIEAGPSVARALHEADAIDELLLSRWTGAGLDDELVVAELPDDATLARHLRCDHATRPDADGWVFERWMRR